MRPTDKLAAIRALIFGLQQAQKAAEEQVRAFRDLTGAKAFQTPFGKLEFRSNPPKIRFDESRLLAWAQKYMAHEVIPEHTITIPATVRPTLLKTLEGRLTIEGDVVVDRETGEVVDFAFVAPGGADTVAFTLDPTVKGEVAAAVEERIELLASAVTPEVAA
jgi:hypothetical protein